MTQWRKEVSAEGKFQIARRVFLDCLLRNCQNSVSKQAAGSRGERAAAHGQCQAHVRIHTQPPHTQGNKNQLVHCKCQPIYVISFYSAFLIHKRVENLIKQPLKNWKQGEAGWIHGLSPVTAVVGCLTVYTLLQLNNQ